MSRNKRRRKLKYYRKKGLMQKPIDVYEGTLSCVSSGGFGFVRVEGKSKDFYVDLENFGTANHGDIVKVKSIPHKNGDRRRPCRIIEVLERKITRLTAVVIADFGGTLAARADDRRYYPTIQISYCHTLNSSIGDRVTVELTDFDSYGDPIGIITQNLGSSKTIKGSIDSIIFTNFIKTDFNIETVNEANEISDTIPESEIQARLDLRGEKIITIDGADAKDFDDAVSIRKLPSGGYKLGVHIADVSHYVKLGSEIDKEAYERGTSVYLPDRVIPMLPERLSNGVCSLRPNEDRLTLSCIMNIDANGDVKSYKIEKSVIRSLHRMTYDDVDKILAGDNLLKKKYSDILLTLSHMNTLCDILTNKRKKRGSIDFDIPEARIVLGSDYSIGELVISNRLKSHQIIEEFMLLANETVAKHCFERNLPAIYRIHEPPYLEKLESLSVFLSNFGLHLPIDDEVIKPKTLQMMLESIVGEPYQSVVTKNTLRSMTKAEYKNYNAGHFGLAADYYCHFTSPIRRYPDLIVHRAISGIATGDTKAISNHSSQTERSAEECERNAQNLLKVIYMKERIGEEFPAVITSLTEYGIYAELENTIEGMIRLESIDGDYYYYDEKYASIFGKRTKKAFKIGDSIDIVVTGADPELLRIDFELKRSSK